MAKEYIIQDALTDFRNDIVDKFIDMCRENDYNKLNLLTIADNIDRIYDAHIEKQTADVAEVVRCKDCKYSVKYSCKNDACYQFTICRRRESYSEGVEENDFCSYGERKEKG